MENETLEQCYERLYSENVDKLELLKYKRNDKIRKSIFTALVIMLIIAILLFVIKICVSDNEMYKSLVSLIFMFVLVFGIRGVYLVIGILKTSLPSNKLKNNEYQELFKENIIIPIVKKYIPESNYMPEQGLDRVNYVLSGWKITNIYESQDRIDLKIKDYESELVLAEVYAEESSSNTLLDLPEFHGLAGYIKLPKKIPCNIKIAENLTSGFYENKFEMDMKDFEKIFDVQTDNKIITAQILTSDVMAELVKLINSTQIGFELRIVGEILFIRFYTCEMFEALAYDKDENFEFIKNYLNIIEQIRNIVKYILNKVEEVEL